MAKINVRLISPIEKEMYLKKNPHGLFPIKFLRQEIFKEMVSKKKVSLVFVN